MLTIRNCTYLSVLITVVQNLAIQIISNCIDEVRAWSVSRKLMFNDTKTEFMIIGTLQQLAKVSIGSISVGDADIKPAQNVRNLGSWFDKHMSMNVHVGKVCSKAFRGLYNIRQITEEVGQLSREFLDQSNHAIFYASWLRFLSSKFT